MNQTSFPNDPVHEEGRVSENQVPVDEGASKPEVQPAALVSPNIESNETTVQPEAFASPGQVSGEAVVQADLPASPGAEEQPGEEPVPAVEGTGETAAQADLPVSPSGEGS